MAVPSWHHAIGMYMRVCTRATLMHEGGCIRRAKQACSKVLSRKPPVPGMMSIAMARPESCTSISQLPQYRKVLLWLRAPLLQFSRLGLYVVTVLQISKGLSAQCLPKS